jgi:hypothetical protein
VAKHLQQQDPGEIERTMLLTAEATAFFRLLAQKAHLPATPTNIVDNFVVAPWPPTFAAKHPLVMRVEVELKDKGKQEYLIKQDSPEAEWVMTEGWRKVKNSRPSKLPVPSDDVQKTVNAAVRECMRKEN